MRKIIGCTLLVFLAAASTPASAASTSDFYMTLLRRGISDVEGGRYDAAITPLRIAAFGLIESVEQYEMAQTHLAIAFDKLGRQDSARDAAQHVIAAERVERKFATLSLPEATRSSFTTVARKVLSAADVAALTAPSKPSATPPPAAIAVKPVTPPAPKPAPVQAATQAATQPAAQTPTKPAATNTNAATTKPVPPPPSTTTAQTTTTAVNPPGPKPAAVPAPAQTSTKPAATTTTRPATTVPVQTPPQPQPARIDVNARIAAGDRALMAANLPEARRAYREVLDAPGVDHATYLRVGEGFYRARDFANALQAFQRAGALRTGEEPYHYYVAVAAYETGDYDRARRELAAALPHIEVTPDVQRYRTKIEGSH